MFMQGKLCKSIYNMVVKLNVRPSCQVTSCTLPVSPRPWFMAGLARWLDPLRLKLPSLFNAHASELSCRDVPAYYVCCRSFQCVVLDQDSSEIWTSRFYVAASKDVVLYLSYSPAGCILLSCQSSAAWRSTLYSGFTPFCNGSCLECSHLILQRQELDYDDLGLPSSELA